MALARFGNRLWNGLKASYQAEVSATLNKYGLKYDDIKVQEDPDVEKALSRLDPAELQLRARRMKRAFDIDFKGKYLPENLQATQKPLEAYQEKLVEEAKARRIERELLNSYK